MIGFGQQREAVEANAESLSFGDNYGKMVTHAWAETMGLSYDRRTVERIFPVAPEDIETPSGLLIPQGTVCCYTTRWSGYVDSINPEKPFLVPARSPARTWPPSAPPRRWSGSSPDSARPSPWCSG